jgi:hypothetical protein
VTEYLQPVLRKERIQAPRVAAASLLYACHVLSFWNTFIWLATVDVFAPRNLS